MDFDEIKRRRKKDALYGSIVGGLISGTILYAPIGAAAGYIMSRNLTENSTL